MCAFFLYINLFSAIISLKQIKFNDMLIIWKTNDLLSNQVNVRYFSIKM